MERRKRAEELEKNIDEVYGGFTLYETYHGGWGESSWELDDIYNNTVGRIPSLVREEVDLVEEQRRLWGLLPGIRKLFRQVFGERNWERLAGFGKAFGNSDWYSVKVHKTSVLGVGVVELEIALHEPMNWRGGCDWAECSCDLKLYASYEVAEAWEEMRAGYRAKAKRIFMRALKWIDGQVLFGVGGVVGAGDVLWWSHKFPRRYGDYIQEEKRRLVALNRIMPVEDLQRVVLEMARDPELFEGVSGKVEVMRVRRSLGCLGSDD